MLRDRLSIQMERVMGFEPTTATLARWCSTRLSYTRATPSIMAQPEKESRRRRLFLLLQGIRGSEHTSISAQINHKHNFHQESILPKDAPWCERGDSNPHARRHKILSLARLPLPPLSRP